METCLSFDTSGRFCSVAVLKENQIFTEQCDPGMYGHATHLVPMIQRVLQQANLKMEAIEVLCVPVGPGSFTGIRIAIATAQGLTLATKIKALTPTTLEIYAYKAFKEHPHCQKILVLLDNKRGGFYSQAFAPSMNPLSNPTLISLEQAQDFLEKDPTLLFISDINIPIIDQRRNMSFSASIAEAALDYCQSRVQPIKTSLRPFYLHDPQFTKYNPA